MAVLLPPFSALNAHPGVTNFGPQQLPVWRQARARVQNPNSAAGTRGRILIIGASDTFGYIVPGYVTGAWPTLLATILTARGLPAIAQSRAADGNYNTAIPTYDPRVALGNWTAGGGYLVFGGSTYHANASTATPLSFTPSANTDTCFFIWPSNFTATFNVNVDGGSNTLINQTSSIGYHMQSLTTTLGSHAYNVLWASGTCQFLGWLAYNSAVNAIDIFNVSWGGARSVDAAANLWEGASALTFFLTMWPADLVILMLGGNDWVVGGVTPAQTITNLQSLVTQAKNKGADVLIMNPIISSTSLYSLSTMLSYINSVQTVAAKNNLVLFDPNYRGVTYGPGKILDFASGDGVHITGDGHADIALAMASLLLAA